MVSRYFFNKQKALERFADGSEGRLILKPSDVKREECFTP